MKMAERLARYNERVQISIRAVTSEDRCSRRDTAAVAADTSLLTMTTTTTAYAVNRGRGGNDLARRTRRLR